MISIRKLPLLEPEMRGALRSHIIRKRQRLKQEIEQDAIERRLKKEREQKRLQDAMTLDQIKEQLTQLEKKLETLRGEKHDLFVQLKQVLNEGNNSSKRKQTELSTGDLPSDANKKPKIEHNDEEGKREPKTSIGVVASSATHKKEADFGLSTKQQVDRKQDISSNRNQAQDFTKQSQQLNQRQTAVQSSRATSAATATSAITTSSEFIKSAYPSIPSNYAVPIMTLPLSQQNYNLNQSPSLPNHTDSTIDLSKNAHQPQLSGAHPAPINLHDLAALQAAHLTIRHPFIGVHNIPPELIMSGRLGANYPPNMLPFNLATQRGLPAMLQSVPMRSLTNDDIRMANFITAQQRVHNQNDLYMTIAGGASSMPPPLSTSFNAHKPNLPDFVLNHIKPEQLGFIHPPSSLSTSSFPNSNMFNNGTNHHPLFQQAHGRPEGPPIYGLPFVQHQQQQQPNRPQGLLDQTPHSRSTNSFSSPSGFHHRASDPRSPYYHNSNR